MGILGQLWDMTSQTSAQILGQSCLKSTLSLINGNCVYYTLYHLFISLAAAAQIWKLPRLFCNSWPCLTLLSMRTARAPQIKSELYLLADVDIAKYRESLLGLYQVWWILFLKLLTTSVSTCLKHSRNLATLYPVCCPVPSDLTFV